MEKNHHFCELVNNLYANIGLADRVETTATTSVITINAKINIAFIGEQEGFLTILTESSSAPDCTDANKLLTLLSFNRFHPVHPPVICAVDPNIKKITLWVREYLRELDSEKLAAIFERLVDTALEVEEWLAKPAQATVEESQLFPHANAV